MATTISVNGANGATLATSSGIRLVQEPSQGLVLYNQQPATRHGQPGKNSPKPISGGPAGTLAVQLSESQIGQGAVHVRRLQASQGHQIPQNTEVPMGRDLHLTAIGGNGESGHDGGDGHHGLDGVDGVGATRASDATNGTDGGDGGAAGRGSSGAHGGPGGDIHIVVDENSTHLLMVVSWDIKGGIGGKPGQHGTAGTGGTRGTGGPSHQWEETLGYTYYCTDSCIRNDAYRDTSRSTSTTLVRMGSHLHASSLALRAPIGALLVSGNNLQRAIVQARRVYHAVERPRADPGACKCGGGTGNCTGCDMKPIIKKFRRAPGLDGKDGEIGATVTVPLVEGSKGVDGTATIAVQHHDGSTKRYTSPWSLELVDFDIEDGNADGAFEPGEILHIRRVRVRNVGGMPSPNCQIPVTLADHSDEFERVHPEDGGIAYLPTSIPAAGEALMEGSIMVRIKPNSRPIVVDTQFHERGWLQIRADMPWLERRLPTFELRKEVDISYPCCFGSFDNLSTIAQGAMSRIQYEVCNSGSQPIGEQGAPPGRFSRVVEVRMTVPPQYGRFLSSDGTESTITDQSIPFMRPRDNATMQQQFCVLGIARSHEHFRIILNLFVENPEQLNEETVDMVLVERRAISLQVSSTYSPKPNAKFLLVTNPATNERQSRAVQDFIQNSLLMEVDLCNAHQNGGLLRASESDFDEPSSILAAYHKKTVIFLNNPFEFFDAGKRSSVQLCNPLWLNELAKNGSCSLFSGSGHVGDFNAVVGRSVFPITTMAKDTLGHVLPSHRFTSQHELFESIQEAKLREVTMGISAVTVKKKWYTRSRDRDEKAAKDLAKFLRDRLPNERFIVTHDDSGQMIVFSGLSHLHCMRSMESAINLRPTSDADPTPTRLDRLTKFMIIAAIPFRQRVDMLWRTQHANLNLLDAIKLSLIQDLFIQIDQIQVSKYRGLLRCQSDEARSASTIIQTHVPFIGYIFSHPQANEPLSAPDAVVDILIWVLAHASSLKRHRNLAELIRSLIQQHSSLSPLNTSHQFSAAVQDCQPERLIDEIAALTASTTFELRKGQTTASQVCPETEYWPPVKWNSMVLEIQREQENLRDDMKAAKRELGRMLMEPLASPVDSAAELSV